MQFGEVGELVIGGVGLARYLDPEKDAEKYAPMPHWPVVWSRAYRSGDLVRLESDGLYFQGAPTTRSRSAAGGSSSARSTPRWCTCPASAVAPPRCARPPAAHRCWSATSSRPGADPTFDLAAARARLSEALPAALVPRLVLVDELPTRTSGKVDRDALPWPAGNPRTSTTPTSAARWAGWPGLWRDVLAAPIDGPEADFFALGGGSLSAAQLVAALRQRYPQVTVAELYDHPRLGSLAGYLDELAPPPGWRPARSSRSRG